MEYLNFLLARAKGEKPTGARYIRDFVLNHPAYKQDSVLSQEISYDLMKHLTKLDNVGSPERNAFLGEEGI